MIKPLKILMVTDSMFRGGKERRMLELIKGLKNQSEAIDVHLISLTDVVEYDLVYQLPIQFTIIKRKTAKDFSVVPRLKKIIRRDHPDIIHSWSTMASVYLSLANLFTGIPMINGVLADASDHLGLSDKHYLRVKLTTPFSDMFVSNSLAGISAYRTPAAKSICIYNGIDFNRFENLRPPADMEKEILGGSKNDRIVMGMVAGFDDRKDYGTLIGAAIKMCSSRKDLVFLLIGSGPLLESLRARVPADLLNNQIIFTGKRSDIESILQILDVGLLITYFEGISNAIIEYMATGKPVVATRGGGTAELVKDGVNGFLVDPSSESQIIEKLEWLISHPEKRREMGNHAYHYVRDQFELKHKTREYIALYRKLAGGGKKTAKIVNLNR